jgi:hypothetical protein
MDMLRKNEFIPAFILHEINVNPDRLFDIMQGSGLNPQLLLNQLQREIQKGNIRQVDPRQLIVNLLSLCIFPFAARPLLQRILFENKPDSYEQFLSERKREVTRFIIQALKD